MNKLLFAIVRRWPDRHLLTDIQVNENFFFQIGWDGISFSVWEEDGKIEVISEDATTARLLAKILNPEEGSNE